MRTIVLLAVFLPAYAVLVGWPTWQSVYRSSSARDFSTYHYAAQVAFEGGDPYATPALKARAARDGAKGSVHPYFYPPPFLLGMLWDHGLPLQTAYRASYWINHASFLAFLALAARWLRPPLWLLGLAALAYTPLPDNIRMGQANLPVLLLMALGLWRGSGV